MNTEYNILLKDPRWQKKRDAILKRDGNKCINCGSNKVLQVHHKQYHISKKISNFILPWNYPERYLITLCEKCHNLGHLKFTVPTFEI
jgi:5-methylcytosine-specific restriction endonuclease McrA